MRKLMLTILLAGGMAAFMPVAAQERHRIFTGREIYRFQTEEHVVFYQGGSSLVSKRKLFLV